MPINTRIPDYDLDERRELTTPAQLRAIADPLRGTILDLLLERAATVAELATAVGRPKSSVAHHVNVLVDAELLRVVRTRRVRAIDERSYGRTARLFMVGVLNRPGDEPLAVHYNALSEAAVESVAAHEADTLRSVSRHAWITRDQAREFWARVEDLLSEFAQLPRTGDTVYGFAVGLYPTEHPTLPEPETDEATR
ncbi:MAG: winged helix-turn-helix domain-containing protein [Chloroflexota bacterium]|nr:winged helix-turn-helix domain-containing protein [Chloroflexota bacterium]